MPLQTGVSASALLVVSVVSKELGSPVSNVSVSIAAKPDSEPKEGAGSFDQKRFTGRDGRVSLEVPSKIKLRLAVDDKSVDVSALNPGEQRRMVVELVTGRDLVLYGRTVASDTYTPVSGANVRIQDFVAPDPTESNEPTLLEEFETDAEGYFRVEFSSETPPQCRIDAKGFGTAIELMVAGHETRDLALMIPLEREARLEGWVGHRSGQGEGGVRVVARCFGYELVPSGEFVTGPSRWSTATDSEGNWELAGLPPRIELTLEYTNNGKLTVDPQPIILAPNETRRMEWILGSGVTISGRAVFAESGRPLVGHDIWLVGESSEDYDYLNPLDEPVDVARTGLSGEFTFSDLISGKWLIGPAPKLPSSSSRTRGRVAPVAMHVEVPPGIANLQIVLEVSQGGDVVGKVLNPDGELLADVGVSAISDRAQILTTRTSDDGSFRFGPLKSEGYELQAEGLGDLASSIPIVVYPGGEEVVLTLTYGASLSGVVISDGSPVSASVTAAAAMGVVLETTTADVRGRYRFEKLIPGTYCLLAESGNRQGRVDEVSLTAGEVRGGLQIQLEPSAVLVLEYQGKEAGARVQVQFAGVSAGSYIVRRGKEQRLSLAAGRVTLALWVGSPGSGVSPRALPPRTVELLAGEEVRLVLTDS